MLEWGRGVATGALLGLWAICAGVTSSAFANEPASRASAQAWIDTSPSNSRSFQALDDGSLRHIGSGLVCPAGFPGVEFNALVTYVEDGQDVMCDYSRPTQQGIETKLTLFFVKAPATATPDSVFATYQNEVKSAYPDAVVQGPAIEFGDEVPEIMVPMRSEEYVLKIKGSLYLSDLVTYLRDGWIIEIRMSTVLDESDSGLSVRNPPDTALALIALLTLLGEPVPDVKYE